MMQRGLSSRAPVCPAFSITSSRNGDNAAPRNYARLQSAGKSSCKIQGLATKAKDLNTGLLLSPVAALGMAETMDKADLL
jgi:trehalose-6-phosphate synthase